MRHDDEDKNFDPLADRLAAKIYGGLKGRLRLAVLRRDFAEFAPPGTFDVLDVGGGEGRMAEWFLERGHRVQLADISPAMVERAAARLERFGHFYRGEVAGLSELAARGAQAQWVNAHALLEWLADPAEGLRQLQGLVTSGGYLSLLIYNRAGWALKNLLRGNFAALEREGPVGQAGGLTPLHPQDLLRIIQTLQGAGFDLLCTSGIRVFSDYDHARDLQRRSEDQIFAQELALSRAEPFWRIARYVHVLARRSPGTG